jgi:hypothetical protein
VVYVLWLIAHGEWIDPLKVSSVPVSVAVSPSRTVFDRYRIVDERNISAALAKTEAATEVAQTRTVIRLRAAEAKSGP